MCFFFFVLFFACVCSLIRPILALNCQLQIEQVNSENDDSDDDPLALCAFAQLCYLSTGTETSWFSLKAIHAFEFV